MKGSCLFGQELFCCSLLRAAVYSGQAVTVVIGWGSHSLHPKEKLLYLPYFQQDMPCCRGGGMRKVAACLYPLRGKDFLEPRRRPGPNMLSPL